MQSYERIAHLYDADMARNMPFDDIALFAEIARSCAGPVLELGCGNGRILLELDARRIAVVGVDRSTQMLASLRTKARARTLASHVCQMDVRALGFLPLFELVLCPYSLVTYMTADDDAARMLHEIRRVLMPSGHVVLDAFIPRAEAATNTFVLDYRRPFDDDGLLVRSKRISRLSARTHRIERRYERFAADGTLVERIETVEDIRTFTPEQVAQLLDENGFEPERSWWDYANGERQPQSRFFTVLARTSRR